MKFTSRTLTLLLFLITGKFAFAQTKKDLAIEKGKQAIHLEDEGKYDEAIKLLEEAHKLDPGSIDYPYELGYSYYAKKDYKKAVKSLEELLDHPQVYDQVFQLLGNCYDDMGKADKAIATYDAGIKKFPASGKLYLEKGNAYWVQKDYNKALSLYEQGIQVEPALPSNYYRAARIYCNSTEEVWGMIYGEIFMNLERNTARTAEISELLYNTYKNQIQFTSDSSFSVSFSKNSTITVNDLKDPDKMKLPFGVGIYEPTLMIATINEKAIDLNSLDRIRKNFVEAYFKNGRNETYPNILFDFQNKILQAGHLEAYNHWLLMKGEEDAFGKWQAVNQEKWADFVKWFSENKLKIDEAHRFYSGQY